MAPANYNTRSCPRCGSHVIGLMKAGEGTPQFFALCRHCFKYGATAASRDEALASWNRSPTKPEVAATPKISA